MQLMQNGLVGKKFASQLHENANGRDDSPVETEVPEAKSISAERTFSNDIGTEKDVDLNNFVDAAIAEIARVKEGVWVEHQRKRGAKRHYIFHICPLG